jgi:rhodanese-related sulfurtransferase
MKTLISVILLGICLSCSPDKSEAVFLSADEMKDIMAMDSVQLIDVRSLEEFRDGHLKGAQNLIYDSEFDEKIKSLDKSKPVAVYCRTGRRSEECSKLLEEAGFEQIYQLKGGLTEWKYKGELIKEDSAPNAE